MKSRGNCVLSGAFWPVKLSQIRCRLKTGFIAGVLFVTANQQKTVFISLRMLSDRYNLLPPESPAHVSGVTAVTGDVLNPTSMATLCCSGRMVELSSHLSESQHSDLCLH